MLNGAFSISIPSEENSNDSQENTFEISSPKQETFTEVDVPYVDPSQKAPVCFSIGTGIILVGFCFWLYHEVQYQRLLKLLRKCMWEVKEAPSYLDPQYEGELVYVTGRLQVGQPVYLTDPVLPIVTVSEAILLKRRVEMFQWKEIAFKAEGKLRYEYKQQWSGSYLDSHRFGDKSYKNPKWNNNLQNATFQCQPEAYLQNYRMTRQIMKKIPMRERLRVVPPCSTDCKVQNYSVYIDDTYYYLTTRENPQTTYTPMVGDYRIKYSYLGVGTNVSILGEQRADTLVKYKEKLLVVESGMLSADKLLDRKIGNKRFRQYIIRIVGVMFALIGFILMT